MTPPLAPASPTRSGAAEPVGAVSSCAPDGTATATVETLRKRADFLKASRARRQATPGFVLQARRRGDAEPAAGLRVGYTCSKKVGNAVARNRAKRRLREIARALLPCHGHPGWDYVLIGRRDTTATRPFPQLLADLETALDRVHK
ncbi:ribonuclease P protein component [Mesobaculum littorinae]|uniref:Ribonuclease P protein component n=1 Tax=Mesobaculum littorinae TaxID=2486419 RepID=A0A438AEJ2_9RHOB|nr:ribonuclease P protein component [Mesobaculum littorinae]RVV97097.1 ribonuclease P protein component [Mesobaculum littorinae]